MDAKEIVGFHLFLKSPILSLRNKRMYLDSGNENQSVGMTLMIMPVRVHPAPTVAAIVDQVHAFATSLPQVVIVS